jgi:hypothetical protein
MQLLAALIVAGLGVRLAIDDLDCPLRALELHLLIVVLLGNLLLAFLLEGWHGHFSPCGSSGSACRWLLVVVVALLLPPILFLAASLSSEICFRLVSFPCLQSRLGVPCMPFYSFGALVR